MGSGGAVRRARHLQPVSGPRLPLVAAARWWRRLNDNPVVHWQAIADRRRRSRVCGLRRNLLWWLLLFYACTAAIVTGVYLSIEGDSFWGVLADMLTVALVLFGLYYLVAAVRTLYHTVSTALGVLGSSRRSTGHEPVLDEHLAVAPLNDGTILAGIVVRLWMPLCALALGGAVLLWLMAVAYTSYGGGHLHHGFDLYMRHVLAWVPLTIGAVALSGSLAGLVLVLWFVALGRGSGKGWVRSATAGLVAVAHLVVNPLLGFHGLRLLAEGHGERLTPTDVNVSLLSTLAVIGACWLLMALVLRLALVSSPVPALLPLSPLFIAAASAVLFFSVFVWSPLPWSVLLPLRLIPSATIPAWLACFSTNPLSVPYADMLGFSFVGERHLYHFGHYLPAAQAVDYYSALHPVEWFRYPLLILQQLGMVLIAYHYALRAVVRRRRQMV